MTKTSLPKPPSDLGISEQQYQLVNEINSLECITDFEFDSHNTGWGNNHLIMDGSYNVNPSTITELNDSFNGLPVQPQFRSHFGDAKYHFYDELDEQSKRYDFSNGRCDILFETPDNMRVLIMLNGANYDS